MEKDKAAALVQLKVSVTADLHRALKVYAATSGVPMNALVSDAVTALLKRKGAL
jgi:predicted HicB family RNase H-like nuclease